MKSEYWQHGDPGSEGDSVFVDGLHEALAIRASGSQGWVTCYRKDAAGNLVRDVFDRPVTQTRSGRVEIRRSKPEAW